MNPDQLDELQRQIDTYRRAIDDGTKQVFALSLAEWISTNAATIAKDYGRLLRAVNAAAAYRSTDPATWKPYEDALAAVRDMIGEA